ncbi:MAG: DNA replication/repair protein RecF [Alphaproteobacteria bacterium]|nr:DNA replication/repair protein RecF [Alphaproteobacteria bacterium]
MPAITSLTLSNFRSYYHTTFDLLPNPVALVGANGSGKTNILEALSFLAPGRGLRRAKLHVIRNNKNTSYHDWGVRAVVQKLDYKTCISTGYQGSVDNSETLKIKRIIKIDDVLQSNQSSLLDLLNVVWLTPQMERIFSEGALERRRFIDKLVHFFDPDHSDRIARFDHFMKQRLQILKTYSINHKISLWLDALEKQLAELAIAISDSRSNLINILNTVDKDYMEIFPWLHLQMKGIIEDWLNILPALEVEEKYMALLAETRIQDKETQTMSIGPHRSDLLVVNKTNSMAAAECSTGEQKVLLIGLILAYAYAQKTIKGTGPLLLLDEIAAHLDETKKSYLFKILLNIKSQFWLTGLTREAFSSIAQDIQFLTISKSVVYQL